MLRFVMIRCERYTALCSLWFGAMLVLIFSSPSFAQRPRYEGAPILYSQTECETRVTQGLQRLASAPITWNSASEFVEQVLLALEVPVESQMLVYSKTSAQNSHISPQTPRAIYFSDDIYVGWVQGGDLEFASFDREIGLVFHRMAVPYRSGIRDFPTPVRDRSCLSCHESSATGNVPGLTARSVFPDAKGLPLLQAGSFRIDHTNPINQRWGGWYVTGHLDSLTHLGNQISQEEEGDVTTSPLTATATPTLLDGLFREEVYPAGGRSDAVALMIFEQQIAVHNQLMQAHYQAREILYRYEGFIKSFGDEDGSFAASRDEQLDHKAELVVQSLLLGEEQVIEGEGVEGWSAFQEAFRRNARKASNRRSLKDLRLYERLFKYRCSHLIYSDAFTNLPVQLKDRTLSLLKECLENPYSSPISSHLSASEASKISTILSETLEGF